MEEKIILSADDIETIIADACARVRADIEDFTNFAVVGVQTRGVELARRMRERLEGLAGVEIKSGVLDITFHRDDLSTRGVLPMIKETAIGFDINGLVILLVDDVIFTGRTIKAALEALTTYGRPRSIKYFALVDRGNRELPIQPDYCGYRVRTAVRDKIRVRLRGIDEGDDRVIMIRSGE